MNEKRIISLVAKQLPNVASVAVGILPIVVLVFWFDVPRKTIGYGVLAYAAGTVGIKLPLYHLLVVNVLHKKLSNIRLAMSQGIVSAFSELGAAYFFFLFLAPEFSFAELIVFGLAAGSVEAVILPFIGNPLEGTPLEGHARETFQRSSGNLSLEWFGVIERVLASCVHTATRGLVYIGYSTSNFFPAALALLGFASIDGRAYFAHLEQWRFDDVQVLGRFYRFLGVVALFLVLLFVSLHYSLM